jgi:OOP family OmpA-OmpF porin
MRSQLAGGLAPLLAAAVALAPTASTALVQQDGSGHWVNSSKDQEWRNAAGQCWRAGYWTPAHAIMECVGKAGTAERKRPEGKGEKARARRVEAPA